LYIFLTRETFLVCDIFVQVTVDQATVGSNEISRSRPQKLREVIVWSEIGDDLEALCAGVLAAAPQFRGASFLASHFVGKFCRSLSKSQKRACAIGQRKDRGKKRRGTMRSLILGKLGFYVTLWGQRVERAVTAAFAVCRSWTMTSAADITVLRSAVMLQKIQKGFKTV
jgi:hypothetical protein